MTGFDTDIEVLDKANHRKGDDTVGNPHRAQISQFELFELILLFKLDKQFPVEQFEATVSQSTVPSPLLKYFDMLCLHDFQSLEIAVCE